ncbi:MAG: MBL fold metallo-hydrolase [Patescibacteria group bacterium]
MTSRLTFCGGAGTVTGANFLLDTHSTSSGQAGAKLLIDCGTLEQEHGCLPAATGTAQAGDTLNTQPFPYDVKEIDALLVTHAHQDHIGRIPRLVRDGFSGAIHSTAATKDLAAVMFDDALGVMKEHAEKFGCEMLYDAADVEMALSLWNGHEYHKSFQLNDVSAEFLDAGHILGSAMIRLTRLNRSNGAVGRTDSHSESVLGGKSIIFSGDIGNTPEPLLRDCESPAGADYLVMESVYGDRVHEGRSERKEALRTAVEEVRNRGGVLLIPSFSIERTQILLFELNDMVEDGSMQAIPVYLDAPLASRVTQVFRKYSGLFNPAVREHFSRGDDPFSFKGLTVVRSTEESRAIHRKPDPKVIIAGAGMSGGGRVRAHEKYYLGDKRTTLLFVGYQASGTLGRRLQEGEKRVVIDKEHVKVRAQVSALTGYSGHADRDQLLRFIENAGVPKKVFITMGEPRASLFLAQRARDFLGVDAVVPQRGESFDIEW